MKRLVVYYDTDEDYKVSKNANIWVSIDGSPYLDPILANKELIKEDVYAALLQKEKYEPVGIFSPIGAEEENIPPIDYETILPVDLRKKLLNRFSQIQDSLRDPDLYIICIRGIPPTRKYLDDEIHDTLKDDYSVIKDRSDCLIANLEELNSRQLLILDQYETLKKEYTFINKIAANLLSNRRTEPAVVKADLKKSLNITENQLKSYNNKFEKTKFISDIKNMIKPEISKGLEAESPENLNRGGSSIYTSINKFANNLRSIIIMEPAAETESPKNLDGVVRESTSSKPIGGNVMGLMDSIKSGVGNWQEEQSKRRGTFGATYIFGHPNVTASNISVNIVLYENELAVRSKAGLGEGSELFTIPYEKIGSASILDITKEVKKPKNYNANFGTGIPDLSNWVNQNTSLFDKKNIKGETLQIVALGQDKNGNRVEVPIMFGFVSNGIKLKAFLDQKIGKHQGITI